MMSEDCYYIGVDVGTSSVRAALFDQCGRMKTVVMKSIQILEPDPNFYEQSSDDIWSKCCEVIQDVVTNIDQSLVKGIGFDATCSLVVLDHKLQPLSVSSTGDAHWNVIMWMDHRASDQANRINQSKHPVLDYVGGTMSLEMQTPKLLWLKENMREACWNRAGHFMDLPDYLTWKATGSLSRSQCSLGCKWTYLANKNENTGFDQSFFKMINLEDLISNNFQKIGGTDVLTPGQPCGQGVSDAAATELGLECGTPVATSIIDAHAGGLGCLGCTVDLNDLELDGSSLTLTSKLALICGTSTCHMATSEEALRVPGVWGPYYSAMVPGYWLNEGGQSASGKLLDHIIENHSAYDWVKGDATQRDVHVHDVIHEILQFMMKKEALSHIDHLTENLHVWPDYHGNRSPLSDPSLRGMMCGLTLSSGVEDLAVQYLATVQALAYGTEHILRSLKAAGHHVKVLYACGGLARNKLFIQTHSNVLGLPIVLPHTAEPVLLGSAILGAKASGNFPSIQVAMTKMGGGGDVIRADPHLKGYHKKKMAVFHAMLEHQRLYRTIMNTDS